MKHLNVCHTVLACAALAVWAPDAMAANESILGNWQIVEAVAAPWSRPQEQAALAAASKRLLKTEVTFAPSSVKSKFKPFDCKSKVIYTPNSIEVDALFQGNLPEPNPAAAATRHANSRISPAGIEFHPCGGPVREIAATTVLRGRGRRRARPGSCPNSAANQPRAR